MTHNKIKLKKSVFLCLVLTIFLLNSITALVVTSNTTSLNVEYDKEVQIPITITNDKSYPIFNIKIDSDYVTMAAIPNLSAGSNKQMVINIKVNKTGIFNYSIKFLGYKQVDCSVITGMQQDVHITDISGFEPSSLRVCAGTSLNFFNDLTQSVNLNLNGLTNTCPGSINIPSGGSSVNHIFDTVGTKSISICSPLYLDNIIDVRNDNILIHEANDDFNFTLNINSVLQPTTLSIEYMSNDNYSMKYNEVKAGSFILKNIGNEKAVNVKINGEWMLFSRSGFNIEPGETKSIDFSIYPGVSESIDTNKSYSKMLSITSDNTPTINRTFIIFILYSSSVSGEGDAEYVKYLHEVFCPAHPFSFLCEQQPRIIEKEVPKYNCPAILAELTPEKALEYIDKAVNNQDANKVYNLIKEYAESQNQSIGDILYKLNISMVIQEDNKKNISDGFTIIAILIFTFLFVALAIIAIILFIKWFNKKKRED